MPISTLACLSACLLAQDPSSVTRGPMLLPQAVVLPRGERRIAVDGTLSDWPELPALQLDDPRQLSGTAHQAWNGPRDLSAFAFLMWDEQDLYIACTVRDEWHRPLDAESLRLSEIPVADSLVLTFDPDRNTRGIGPDPGRREDREFWLADNTGREVVQWDRLRGTARTLDEKQARVVVLHDTEQGITTYEARLPWSEILPVGRQPKAGMVLDLQVVINDYDEATDPFPQTRIGWTFGCSAAVDPGLLGSIMLVADREALQGKVPEFPPKPGTPEPSAPPESYWHDLTSRLLNHPPAVHDGSTAPELAGGSQRFKVLEEIDDLVERFPRVDLLELHLRSHRRMNREVAGMVARGLPWWWRQRLQAVSRAAADPVPNETARLFRLPMGGWLVATPTGGFGVDVAGADLAEWLWGRLEFCVLTRPLEIAARNDQLLLRMLLNKPPRAVLTHIAFHLPAIQMLDMPLAEPGTSFGPPGGPRLRALGSKLPDGSVTNSCSYALQIPNGPHLVWVAPALRPEELPAEPADAMIASPYNPALLDIVAKGRPRLVILDETMVGQALPNLPRVNLRKLHQVQKNLQPQPSLILAPGESWDIARGR